MRCIVHRDISKIWFADSARWNACALVLRVELNSRAALRVLPRTDITLFQNPRQNENQNQCPVHCFQMLSVECMQIGFFYYALLDAHSEQSVYYHYAMET